ncbi:hypothetical protein C2G38_2208266 [Gigaspora rosea]|uniref:Uncharacterized protein n=1 Tax=Gigaspora rosea TaxID=44941 RepID=A0A397UJH4_9GLOM|nr:hypothetical protein C2G38_2208266 [Gigaspora rosea]
MTTSNDVGDKLLKNNLIEAFNICIKMTNIYTLEDLVNSLKIEQNTVALKFRGKFKEKAIIDLTKLIDIESNNKFALRYRGEAYYQPNTKSLGIEPSDDIDKSLKKIDRSI